MAIFPRSFDPYGYVQSCTIVLSYRTFFCLEAYGYLLRLFFLEKPGETM